jgi:hypothetical protein
MATKIILKKSSTTGSAPLIGDIDQGELAVNLADRKIYTKNNSGAIVTVNGAYVDSVAPPSPAEGDLWYDTVNNLLKSYNGSAFVSAGYSTLESLEDVTITGITSGEILKWDGSAFVNNTLAEAGISATGHTHTASDITDFSTAVDSELSGGVGVSYNDGVISIGQAVATSDDVTFNDMELTGTLYGPSSFTIDPSTHGDDTGTVVIAGNLTVNGTTTSVNSNEVNIGDSVILLNSDETGVPSQNGGIEIERGTSANVSFVWNEASDAWDMNNETLQNVVLDGGTY